MGHIQLEVAKHIAYLTIKSPPANALSSNLLDDLESQLNTIEEDGSIKVIVLHGEGKFFSAGADIKEFTSLNDPSAYKFAERGQKLFDRLENSSIPVIAAIHGAALGGGLELAMACHMRIVTETAKLGLPEITLGIIPGYAGTQRLPRYVGTSKAYEMILTGKPISGQETLSLGLANKVVKEDDLMKEVNELAKSISSMSKPSINEIMRLLSFQKSEHFEQNVNEEALSFQRVFGTEDAKEGIQAFLEKRKPKFQDK
ncbi:enoyl-CoA hydratase [Oceanobacillus senegalensis]|uniref:enoyl-CoA hydratase n=1 Tax=Oceanobacillus senegalensis TaxID=1936063 RepID=UPI000A30D705|nr:enoyl-CoA hydratase [Oceanobacillus senegalensis]